MLAQIVAEMVQGKIDTADVFFFVALILAVVSAVLYASNRPDLHRWAPVLLSLAIAGIALALWVL